MVRKHDASMRKPRPPKGREGQWEGTIERWREGWREVEFNRPRGRWNLVAQCSECRRFVHNLELETSYNHSQFPWADRGHRHNTLWLRDGMLLCQECEKPPFCHVYPCDGCGVFCGAARVRYRPDLIGPRGRDWWPNVTCGPCYRRLRRLLPKLIQMNEERLVLQRLGKQVRQAIKEERKVEAITDCA